MAICYNAVAPNICSQISIYFICQVFHILNNCNSQIHKSHVRQLHKYNYVNQVHCTFPNQTAYDNFLLVLLP